MFCKINIFFLLINILFSSALFASSAKNDFTVVRIRKTIFKNDADQTNNYKYQLLELLLNKTKEEYGDYRIDLAEAESQERVIRMVIDGDLDLIMTTTSKEREERLIPIRIPIYKGLYGFRIFMINKSDQFKFDAIKNEKEIKQLTAGQGIHWPDYEILKANGYKVTGPARHTLLFDMLAGKRFDYFPRGIHEPWLELKQHPDKDFIIEERLCLSYPSPGYIFVSPKNRKLAERLEKGFLMSMEDGTFDQLFHNHPDIKETLEKAHLNSRQIFYLRNPLLTKETPLDKDNYWFKP